MIEVMERMEAELATPGPVVFEMVILDRSGDTRLTWDPDRPAELKHARKTFAKMIADGYAAYKVGKKGERGSIMHDFDEKAAKMILAPALVGG